MRLRCNIVIVFFTFLCVNWSWAKMCWPNGVVARYVVPHNSPLLINSEDGFVLCNPDDPKRSRRIRTINLHITAHDNQIVLNGIFLDQQELVLHSPSGTVTINSELYFGLVKICTSNQDIVVVIMSSSKNNRLFKFQEYIWHAWHGYHQTTLWHRKSERVIKELEDVLAQVAIPRQLLTVRVLLDEWSNPQEGPWHFKASDGFVISDVASSKKKRGYLNSELMITTKKGKIYFNGKRSSAHAVYLEPVRGYITFNGSVYQGSFLIAHEHGRTMCINCLALEDYVFSVLRTESWPGWPLEVNKAFAIVSRSYVISMILESRKSKRAYHVKNTNAHQTYKGFHNSRIIQQAVEQTKGIFLGFEGKPALAMFDSCCGGVIPAHIADFNFDLAPYLARDYACTYCKRCKIYSWEVSYDYGVFENLMAKQAFKLNRLCDVKVTKFDRAGLVDEVTLQGFKQLIKVPGKKLYSMLKDIKSFCFNVRKKADKIIFKGRGYGHHIGLCQWGAREMVRDGWDYKNILRFYYPSTNFMRLI